MSLGVRNCLSDLAEVRPTGFLSVPAIYARIMHAINAKVHLNRFYYIFYIKLEVFPGTYVIILSSFTSFPSLHCSKNH